MQIPSPHGLTLQEWSQQTMLVLDQFTVVFALQGEDWQGWGMLFFLNPSLDSLNPPNPYLYTDWREWAEHLSLPVLSAPPSITNPYIPVGPSPVPRPPAGNTTYYLTTDSASADITDDSGTNQLTSQ